jgi:hypothetical protein
MEDRLVPSVVYSNTFDWNGVASVTETVTDDDPSHPGQYRWDFQVTNESFAPGIDNFALPAEDSSLVTAMGNSAGWFGSVGMFMSDRI